MEKYRMLEVIGIGSFGEVVKAENIETHEIVAIKKMKQKFATWDECMNLRELKSLRKLQHKNIVKLKEVLRISNELSFVFEHVDMDIFKLYDSKRKAGSRLPESQIKSIAYQLAAALAFIHKHGYFHRDLKPENILLATTGCSAGTLKLIDFGLAREIRSRPPYTEYVATRWYRAPELLLASQNYSSPVDIFAFGCIIAELFMLKPLFNGASETDQLNKLCAVLGTPLKNDWQEGFRLASVKGVSFPAFTGLPLAQVIQMGDCPVKAIELITECLRWDPSKRITAQRILTHPYFLDVKDVLPLDYFDDGQQQAGNSNSIDERSRETTPTQQLMSRRRASTRISSGGSGALPVPTLLQQSKGSQIEGTQQMLGGGSNKQSCMQQISEDSPKGEVSIDLLLQGFKANNINLLPASTAAAAVRIPSGYGRTKLTSGMNYEELVGGIRRVSSRNTSSSKHRARSFYPKIDVLSSDIHSVSEVHPVSGPGIYNFSQVGEFSQRMGVQSQIQSQPPRQRGLSRNDLSAVAAVGFGGPMPSSSSMTRQNGGRQQPYLADIQVLPTTQHRTITIDNDILSSNSLLPLTGARSRHFGVDRHRPPQLEQQPVSAKRGVSFASHLNTISDSIQTRGRINDSQWQPKQPRSMSNNNFEEFTDNMPVKYAGGGGGLNANVQFPSPFSLSNNVQPPSQPPIRMLSEFSVNAANRIGRNWDSLNQKQEQNQNSSSSSHRNVSSEISHRQNIYDFDSVRAPVRPVRMQLQQQQQKYL